MLKLQFRDRRRESVWLVDQNFTIGKAADNSLMINEKDILDHHIQITNTQEKLSLNNVSSSSNVLLNDKPVATNTSLKAGDVITIGSIELELIDPKSVNEQSNAGSTTNYSAGWSIYSSASWLDQSRFVINKRVVIGRDPSCDITLPLEHLSRKHVALEVKSGQLYMEDLDSSNGTFLNGRQVKQSAVKNGDKIKLDVLTFEVNGPAHDPNKTIIRSASDSTPPSTEKTSSSRLSTKIEQPEKKPVKKPAPKQTAKPKPKAAKKRLASNGKQEWISGDSKPTNKNKSSSMTGIIIASIIAIAAITAFIYFQ
ncbi:MULTISPECIES: FHA domain-containing protein [unclassified Oleiphilus]|jgi:pSer/pThr/pTyr-binding forkhead associated (FHA) protein|nr:MULTISPECIES: FHA domain-containing protein [unclassified Oleiphilus]KZY41770.1 hypothetical protein A3732_17535 [Oleiphilus sp. HI0050]KZY85695.1 hypothetical protein A3741_15075 [Oleiphilus sp. HI0069]KZY88583.1 hypothetical protein A3743_11250 [Oleiphilus sp. HI0072]KZY56195.1 hypothetical protein A3735_04795 [Oleiphilus sp. HI0061]KZZ35397.1 hypothetical protein A3756_15815 [Oleiphilus sp. HI0086]